MSLARKDFMRTAATFAAPFALAFGLAASSNVSLAADQCLPGVYNAERGIKGGDCYATPEMNKALKVLNQRSLIFGERITVGDDASGQVQFGAKLNVFTSNPEGTLGFNIEGDAPAGQQSGRFSVGAVMRDIRLWDLNKPVLPSEEVVGRLNAQGIQKSGDRLMLSAKYGQGVYLVVVARNDEPKVGSFLSANGQKGADLAALKNLGYTKSGEELIRQQSGQQVSTIGILPK